MLRQMWEMLDAYTVSAVDGSERSINVRNEWGGFSRRLHMPVFTGWQDHVRSVNGQMRVLISDRHWHNAAGVNNQERWVAYSLEHDCEAAFFVIKARDPLTTPRAVEWLDDTRVLCGKVDRQGNQAFITASRDIPL